MALVKDISGTAFVVAEFRAEENKEETPLYNDWVVELFLLPTADTPPDSLQPVFHRPRISSESARSIPMRHSSGTSSRMFDRS